jgi:hypothetical protein
MEMNGNRTRRTLSLAIAAFALVHAGCGAIIRDAAREATPAMISGAVEGFADPDTQRRLVEAIDEGRVRTVSARVSAAFLDGVLDTLEDPARRARLEALLNGLVARAAGTAVETMLERVLDAKVGARLQLALKSLMIELVTVVFETVEARTGTPEERTMALGAAAHAIAKQATLGVQNALDETVRDRASGKMEKGEGALLIAADSASQTGSRILWTLGIGLTALAAGLALTLFWAIRKNRSRRSELAQRDGALLLLTEAIQSAATRPGADELLASLRTAVHDRAGSEHVRKLLGEQGRTLLGFDKPA